MGQDESCGTTQFDAQGAHLLSHTLLICAVRITGTVPVEGYWLPRSLRPRKPIPHRFVLQRSHRPLLALRRNRGYSSCSSVCCCYYKQVIWICQHFFALLYDSEFFRKFCVVLQVST